MKKLNTYIVVFLIYLGTIGFSSSVFSQNPFVQVLLDEIEIDSILFSVRQLTGELPVTINGQIDTIKSRHVNAPGNELAFQYAKQRFLNYNLQVDSLQFSTNGKNLIGVVTGDQHPEQMLIIGAHYDNRPDTLIAPGADDNASGSATVLEAARVFSNFSFPYTLVFCLWDEEEQGLIGSKAYTAQAAVNDKQIIGYINVDMLGWDGNDDHTADIHVRPVAQSIDLANKAIMVDSIYEIGLDIHLVNPGITASDHSPFWDEGYSAIAIAEEYDNDFNPFWHSTSDSLGQFNIPFYEKVVRLALATLAECALTETTVSTSDNLFEESFKIQIYPNPFYGLTKIEYSLPLSGTVAISIHNNEGKKVKSFPVENQQPGKYTLIWNDIELPVGIYWCKWLISIPNKPPFELSKPIFLLR